MQNPNSKNVPNGNTTSPVTNIGTIKPVLDRLKLLLPLFDDPADILDERNLDILFKHVRDLPDKELTKLSLNMHNAMRQIGRSPSPATIERIVGEYLKKDKLWKSRTFVYEETGQIHIRKSKSDDIAVSNFILIPKYAISVYKGHKYHVYDVKIVGDSKLYQVVLKAEDFNKLETLQNEIAKQLMGTSAYINGCSSYMKDLAYKYIDLAGFEEVKQGTSLLGLERLENDGPKYFCTPNGIYDMNGKKSDDILYMRNDEANQEELNNLTNLEYDENKWPSIAKEFLSHIIRINEKHAMMALVGWMGAIPHDYVIRKEVPTNYFPHCHLVGEPGSGKSTIMTLLKQFMGHNDSAPRTFPTPFETSKLLNSSYTIPAVLDEYAKRWKPEQLDAINRILVEAFTKARWSRGTANLNSIYFKYKNPLLFGGQIPTTDMALSTRIVPVQIFKSFQHSNAGQSAMQHIEALQLMEDKNFWTGYNLWCGKSDNESVKKVFIKFRKVCRATVRDNRVADIYTVVMLGLFYMKKLADELGVDIGYTESDIEKMPEVLANLSSDLSSGEMSPLDKFLQDIASYGIVVGNSHIHGQPFGKGRSVMLHVPAPTGCGTYGNKNPRNACIYGRELVLIKVQDMVDLLNKYKGKNSGHNYEEIMTFIEGNFRESIEKSRTIIDKSGMEDKADFSQDDSLVLAPKQYKTKYGMYTAFNKKALFEQYEEFHTIFSIIKD